MMTLNEIASREIRALRRERGWTLAQFAVATEMSIAYLSEVERGKINLPLATLERIATALAVSPLLLLGVIDDADARRVSAQER